jgi:capsular exopolysaccharide synthesis family protein
MEADHKIAVAKNTIARLEVQIEEYRKSFEATSAELKIIGGSTAEMVNKVKLAENLRSLVNELDIQVRKARIEKGSPPRVSRYGVAMPPESTGATRKYAMVGLSGIAVFGLVGLGIAFMEFQSRRITCPSDLRSGLGIRVVGSLPSMSRPGRKALAAVNGDLSSLLVESIDTVRTNLLHSAASEPMRVVMITSALDREGKTTVASQLAASLARGGRRTLLIDGDLRRPSAHRLFELPLEPGLCEVLRTEADLDDVIRPTRIAGLWMIAAGQYDLESIQALSKEGAKDFFDMLRSRFDFIIVDAAPVLSIADSSMLGQLVDAAVLCVMRDVSQAAKVYEASEQLHSVGVEVLGAVLNGEKATAGYRSNAARK